MRASEQSDITALLKSLLSVTKELPKEPPYIKTDLLGWNSLVGGMPVGSLFGLFGMPASNKSILSMQLAWTYLQFGANALLVDTEGGAGDFALIAWADALNKRFGTNIQINRATFNPDTCAWTFEEKPQSSNTFFVVDSRNIIEILKIHGYKMRLEISEPSKTVNFVCPTCKSKLPSPREGGAPKCRVDNVAGEPYETIEGGGKVDVRYDPKQAPAYMPAIELDVRKTPIGELVGKHNIKYVVYDSITNPTEIYVSGQLNFPGRDNVNGLWFQQIQNLVQAFNVTAVGIFHLSLNPTSPYDKYGHPIGGKSVGHNFKFLVLIRRLAGAAGQPFTVKADKINTRKLFLMRHPRKRPFATSSTFEMGDDGFRDSEFEKFDDE